MEVTAEMGVKACCGVPAVLTVSPSETWRAEVLKGSVGTGLAGEYGGAGSTSIATGSSWGWRASHSSWYS